VNRAAHNKEKQNARNQGDKGADDVAPKSYTKPFKGANKRRPPTPEEKTPQIIDGKQM
jgi:hypothetical protein